MNALSHTHKHALARQCLPMGAQRGVVRALTRTSLQTNPCTEESEASEMVQQ